MTTFRNPLCGASALLTLLLLAACAKPPPPPDVPEDLKECALPAPAPAPLPALVTPEQLRTWAIKQETARRRTAEALMECARTMDRLVNWTETRGNFE